MCWRQTLAAFAGLDEALSTVQAELTTHEPSYQTVLGQRQLAASVAPREAALAQQRAQWQETTAALAQVQRLRQPQPASQFDAVEYASILAEERTLRGAFGSLQAQVELLAREQQRDEAEIEVLHREQTRLEAVQTAAACLRGARSAHWKAIRTLLRQAGPLHYPGGHSSDQRGRGPDFWRDHAGLQPPAAVGTRTTASAWKWMAPRASLPNCRAASR